ncbi:MAG TPA: ACT domain-containing protein, partial [Burkholderiales bacterium]
EDFLLALSRGDIKTPQLASGLREGEPPPAEEQAPAPRRKASSGSGDGILVLGVDKLLTTLAKCCRPLPPDPIIGFVSHGRGVTIHRQGCPSIERLSAEARERLIPADWGAKAVAVYPVSVQVDAHDRQGLLRDVSEVFSREKINVIATNTLTRSERARMQFTVEIHDGAQLLRLVALLKEVPSVIAARRV